MLAIVAHTARAEQAHHLMDTVGAAYMHIDDGTLGCNKNHVKVWTWLAEHCHTGWATVLEDDAQPIDDFTHQHQQALNAAPADTPAISWYLGRERPPHWQPNINRALKNATADDACWITTQPVLHAVAISIRHHHIPAMLTHIGKLPPRMPIDEAITHWLHNNGKMRCLYSVPSLVDHADGETLFRHPDKHPRTPGRKAHLTGTRTTWTPRTVTM